MLLQKSVFYAHLLQVFLLWKCSLLEAQKMFSLTLEHLTMQVLLIEQ